MAQTDNTENESDSMKKIVYVCITCFFFLITACMVQTLYSVTNVYEIKPLQVDSITLVIHYSDSVKDRQLTEIDSLKESINQFQKEYRYLADKSINDYRQEVNNLINKINGWLSFWLAIFALVAGIVPLLIQMKANYDSKRELKEAKDELDRYAKEIKQSSNDNISNAKENIERCKQDLETLQKLIDKNEIISKSTIVTNLVSAIVTAKDNHLLDESCHRERLWRNFFDETHANFKEICRMVVDKKDYEYDRCLQIALIQMLGIYSRYEGIVRKSKHVDLIENILDDLKKLLTSYAMIKSNGHLDEMVDEIINNMEIANAIIIANKD